MNDILAKAKIAVMVSGNSHDAWLNSLIESAKLDLGIAGVEYPEIDDLVTTAIITYVRMHFNATPAEFDKLRGAYEMQKAQMMNATGYTNWGGSE